MVSAEREMIILIHVVCISEGSVKTMNVNVSISQLIHQNVEKPVQLFKYIPVE